MKKPSSSLKLFKLSILLCVTSVVFSCKNPGSSAINQNFQEKYGSQVEKIQDYYSLQRKKAYNESRPKSPRVRSYKDPSQILGNEGPSKAAESFFDTTQLSNQKQQNFKPHTPDIQTLRHAKQFYPANNLPDDLFSLKYQMTRKLPYKVVGYEFDRIKIPKKDAFGINSDLNDKKYIIAGNDDLQRSLDQYSKAQTEYDNEISDLIIKEKRKIEQEQRYKELYDTNNEEDLKKPSKQMQEDKSWILRKKEIRNDPVRKIIATQVIKYNLYKNRPKVENKNNQSNQNNQNNR